MPSESEHPPGAPVPQQDAEATAFPGPANPGQARRGYGSCGGPFDRDESEDLSREAFDYPSPGSPVWSTAETPRRHRPVLLVAAVLIAVGGFGFALSLVSDTVSSGPAPSGTAPASESTWPSAPEPTASEKAPPDIGAGGKGAATATRSGPPSGDAAEDEREREHERGQDGLEDHEREDGDDSGSDDDGESGDDGDR